MSERPRSYLIVGAGVFGVSTAYHLIRKYPTATITLVDRDAHDADSRIAASWDWNKVVRADYDDLLYCSLGLEAQDVFRSDALWSPHYHESGIFWMCRSDYATKVLENYKALGRQADLAAVPVEQARDLYGGVFRNANYDGVKEVLVNKTSGWAAAGDCLRAVTEDVLHAGVKYVVGDVSGLHFDSKGDCCGVRLYGSKSLYASHVVLCTGAYTPLLLELSAKQSGNHELAVGDRIVAAGITTGMTKLDVEAHRFYSSMPVGVQGYTPAQGPFIGSLPPTKDRELKWWGQTIFRNTHEVLPNRSLSAPPAARDYAQWEIPQILKEDIEHARDVFYGPDSRSWKMEKHRICWDAFTTSGDFIISPHSAARGLYVATCGNFHGWKFFPVIGKYVVQMLEGSLSKEMADRWAWDRHRPDPAEFADWPRTEMAQHLMPDTKSRL